MRCIKAKHIASVGTGEAIFLYNPRLYKKVLKVNADFLELLDYFEESQSLEEFRKEYPEINLNAFIDKCINNHLLVESRLEEEKLIEEKAGAIEKSVEKGEYITHLELNLTTLCNFACKYCYQEEQSREKKVSIMPESIAKEAIEKFFNHIIKNSQKNATVLYVGGEPLLNFKILKYCFELIDRVKENVEVTQFIYTNGSLITDEIAQTLAAYNCNIQFSLDGIESEVAGVRIFKNGKDGYDEIIKGLNVLKKNNIQVAIHSVLTKDYHKYEVLEQFIDFLVESIGKDIVYDISFAENKFIPADQDLYREIFLNVIKAIKYARSKGIMAALRLGGVSANPKIFYCAGTGKSINVYPDGSVAACQPLNFIKFGSINDGIEKLIANKEFQIIARRHLENIPSCHACEVQAFCAGGCMAVSYEQFKDFYKTPNWKCDVIKEMIANMLDDPDNLLISNDKKNYWNKRLGQIV